MICVNIHGYSVSMYILRNPTDFPTTPSRSISCCFFGIFKSTLSPGRVSFLAGSPAVPIQLKTYAVTMDSPRRLLLFWNRTDYPAVAIDSLRFPIAI